MTRDLVLAGVGGQGIVLASRLIAQAAMRRGLKVRTAETIGMAQRGGSVVSHVRLGDDAHSPLVPLGAAAAILGFEPAEAVRSLAYLAPDGAVVVSRQAIAPVTACLAGSGYDGAAMLDHLRAHVKRVVVVDADAACAECGSARALNVALLGAAAAAGVLGVTLEELESAIAATLPDRYVGMNLRALHAGARHSEEAAQ